LAELSSRLLYFFEGLLFLKIQRRAGYDGYVIDYINGSTVSKLRLLPTHNIGTASEISGVFGTDWLVAHCIGTDSLLYLI
jgi:hypothetical protein